ncbi:MAG: hypothetical protein OXC59_06005 [Acidimicrobiaceae bacterium]|nr:hypothetical protein [Acidimicrobiaceae bacterium]
MTLVRFWMRRSIPTDASTAAPAATLADSYSLLRCERCDVTWRGPSNAPCWCCGAPGHIRGEVRIFAD